MNTSDAFQAESQSALATRVSQSRTLLSGRSAVLLLIGAAVLGAGIFFGWGWLVALGITPVLLGVLPCVAMCGLGLCINHTDRRACDKQRISPEQRSESSSARNE